MSNIQTGYVRNLLTDEVDANDLRFYLKGEEGLVVAARTTDGFITCLIDKATKVLPIDNISSEMLKKMNESAADLVFVVTDKDNDTILVELDADGYERSDTSFLFSDIWEVTYDDVEEFTDEFPEELFESFGM